MARQPHPRGGGPHEPQRRNDARKINNAQDRRKVTQASDRLRLRCGRQADALEDLAPLNDNRRAISNECGARSRK